MSNQAMSDVTTRQIGKLLDDQAKMDAIHIAVAPLYAKIKLYPGQHVGADGSPTSPHVGIVDPYLPYSVPPGERFFLFLYPGTITSLRHEWTHPAFHNEHYEGIKRTADLLEMSPEELLRKVDSGDLFFGTETYDVDYKDFWDSYEAYRGVKTERPYFQCAC